MTDFSDPKFPQPDDHVGVPGQVPHLVVAHCIGHWTGTSDYVVELQGGDRCLVRAHPRAKQTGARWLFVERIIPDTPR